MGYWGTGSFENDYSRNILDDFVSELSKSIVKGISDPEVVEWDSYAIDKLVVDMEVFMALVGGAIPVPVFLDWHQLDERLPIFEKQWLKNAHDQEFHTRRLIDIKELWLRVVEVLKKHEAEVEEQQE